MLFALNSETLKPRPHWSFDIMQVLISVRMTQQGAPFTPWMTHLGQRTLWTCYLVFYTFEF